VDRFLIDRERPLPCTHRFDFRSTPPNAAEAPLVECALEKIGECALAAGAVATRLVVVGEASERVLEMIRAATGAASVELAGVCAGDGWEATLRRVGMKHAPRGQLIVLWLASGMAGLAPVEARRVLREMRKAMWRQDGLLIAVDANYPAETVAAMCAAAAFQSRGHWVDESSGYSVSLVVAD
jgi:hypothetical protein